MPRGPKCKRRPADVNARADMVARIETGEIDAALAKVARHTPVAEKPVAPDKTTAPKTPMPIPPTSISLSIPRFKPCLSG